MLRLLQANGRLSNADLAKKAGVSAATCHRRTQRLFEEGLIAEVRAMVDPRKVGRGALSTTSFITKKVRVWRTPGSAISCSPWMRLKSAMSPTLIFRK